MKVCLVIPVFNERDQLEATVRTILNTSAGWHEWNLEIVIANNGSNDGTAEIAEELARSFKNVRHEFLAWKGRGRALRQAWLGSNAEILAYFDVDLSTDLSFFPSLISPLELGNADISVGSRLLRPEWTIRGRKRQMISRCYNRLLQLAFAPPFSDAQCGFKAITRKAGQTLIPLIEDNAWFFDTEMLLLANHLGFRIFDLPVKWKDDPDSRVRILSTAFADLRGILRMKRRLRQLKHEKLRSAQLGESSAWPTKRPI